MNNNANTPAPEADNYLQSLYKLIPTEITAAYLAIYSVLNPLNSIGEPEARWVFGALFVAITALAVANYLAFPTIRKVTRTDVRIYVSVTFLVWVLGTSVDFWIAFLASMGLDIPHSIFLVAVIIWAVGSWLFLQRSGIDDL